MKTTMGYAQWFVNECARAAREGWKSLCEHPQEHYLWFKRGALLISAEERPEGYELGWAERVPGNLTVQQLTAWVHQRSTRLACLPGEEGAA